MRDKEFFKRAFILFTPQNSTSNIRVEIPGFFDFIYFDGMIYSDAECTNEIGTTAILLTAGDIGNSRVIMKGNIGLKLDTPTLNCYVQLLNNGISIAGNFYISIYVSLNSEMRLINMHMAQAQSVQLSSVHIVPTEKTIANTSFLIDSGYDFTFESNPLFLSLSFACYGYTTNGEEPSALPVLEGPYFDLHRSLDGSILALQLNSTFRPILQSKLAGLQISGFYVYSSILADKGNSPNYNKQIPIYGGLINDLVVRNDDSKNVLGRYLGFNTDGLYTFLAADVIFEEDNFRFDITGSEEPFTVSAGFTKRYYINFLFNCSLKSVADISPIGASDE